MKYKLSLRSSQIWVITVFFSVFIFPKHHSNVKFLCTIFKSTKSGSFECPKIRTVMVLTAMWLLKVPQTITATGQEVFSNKTVVVGTCKQSNGCGAI